MRVLAEIIASDVSLLVTFNQAIDGVIQNNQKSQQNPKALSQLDGYKRPLVGSLSANLQLLQKGQVYYHSTSPSATLSRGLRSLASLAAGAQFAPLS
jgi:hypothetical protein